MDIKEANSTSLENERKHWWIQTRYNYIDKSIKLLKESSIDILEIGCGTGQNLWFLKNQSRYRSKVKSLTGFDPNLSEEFKIKQKDIADRFENDLSNIKQKFDLILAMDVLEHIENDQDALNKWQALLNPNGVILITVPAFNCLWSYHDDFLEHKRRYIKSTLLPVTKSCNLKPLYINYAFSYLFLVMYLMRKLIKTNQKSDLALPSVFINSILKTMGKMEFYWGGGRFLGTSLIGVFKKRL